MGNFIDKHFGRMGNRMFQMAYIYAQFRDGVIPDIFLQDPKYFDKYRDEIRELFKQEGEPLDYVSIHVRRGKNPSNPDEPAYSENPFYVNLMETDYYEKAMAEFPNEKFRIFSDDLEWCAYQPLFGKCDYYFPGTEIEDFNLMTRCKGHIIANSSYSWWAAYISGNKTIAPKSWYTDGVERTKCPKEWTRI